MDAAGLLLDTVLYTATAWTVVLAALKLRHHLLLKQGLLREPMGEEKQLLQGLVAPETRVYLYNHLAQPIRLAGALRRKRILGITLWPGTIALDQTLLVMAYYNPKAKTLLAYIAAHEEGHLKTFHPSIALLAALVGIAATLAENTQLPQPLGTITTIAAVLLAAITANTVSEKIADRYAEKKTGIKKKYLIKALTQ